MTARFNHSNGYGGEGMPQALQERLTTFQCTPAAGLTVVTRQNQILRLTSALPNPRKRWSCLRKQRPPPPRLAPNEQHPLSSTWAPNPRLLGTAQGEEHRTGDTPESTVPPSLKNRPNLPTHPRDRNSKRPLYWKSPCRKPSAWGSWAGAFAHIRKGAAVLPILSPEPGATGEVGRVVPRGDTKPSDASTKLMGATLR